MPRLAKHDPIARRLARETVASGVTREIRLGLDYRPAAGTGRRVADQPVTKQSRRHDFGRGFEKASRERDEIVHRGVVSCPAHRKCILNQREANHGKHSQAGRCTARTSAELTWHQQSLMLGTTEIKFVWPMS